MLSFLNDNSYYFCNTNVHVHNGAAEGIVIVSTGTVTVDNGVNMIRQPGGTNGSILFASGNVAIAKSVQVKSLIPFPAVVSASGNVTFTQTSIVQGAIYAAGNVSLDVGIVNGVIVAYDGNVTVSGTTQVYDQDNPGYYAPMPGFDYAPGQISLGIVPGTWREIQ